MDLSDIFLDKPPVQARAGGKFQPRAKQRPRKEASASVPAAAKEVTASAAPEKQGCLINIAALFSDAPDVQNLDNDVSSNRLIPDVPECNNGPGTDACSNLGEKNAAIGLCSLDDADMLSVRNAGADGSENLGVHLSQEGDQHSKQTKDDASGDSHLTLAKSVGEIAAVSSDLECHDQLLEQSSNVTGAAHKATCTIDMAGQPENMETRPEDVKAIPIVEADEMMFDAATGTGRRVGKFKPKPALKGVEKHSTNVPQGIEIASVMHPPNNERVSAENDHLEGGSVPVVSSEDILGYPSMGTGDFVSLDPCTLEQPISEEMMTVLETSNSYDAPSEYDSKMPGGGGEYGSMNLKSHSTSNPSGKSTSPLAPDEDKLDRRSSKQLRKRAFVPHLGDEPEEDIYDEGSPASDPPTTAADDVTEDISMKKGAGRKAKNPVAENKKSVQKSKKVASDEQAKQTPKKFPRATRRKRRCVDQTLLETPEEEYERLPMKDLILLADYKEHLAKKEANGSKNCTSSASLNPNNEDDDHNEEGFNELEDHRWSGGDQTGQVFQKSSGFFNYHSFLRKEPRVKWSKEETELFYQAIQQFGTDFSMIQQLFPGRSRKQMKAKYRLEERKHPLRMSEASETRAKDLSHFERLVQQLKQAAPAKAEHTIAKDVTEDMARKEDGPTPVKVPEHEKCDMGLEDQGTGSAKEGSPSRVDESDYDDDMFTYQSVF